MFELPFSKKTLTIAAILSSFLVLLLFLSNYFNSQTRVVFCDVGQGDGAYIRIRNRTDVVIDAGPDRKILHCLGKYMPFYDRTIELAIISHPQKDHFAGFLYLIDRYDIKKFWMSNVYNSSLSFRKLLDKIDVEDIDLDFPKAGNKVNIGHAEIEFFWPSADFVIKNTFIQNSTPLRFRETGMDINNFSLIFSLYLDRRNILFTGDASSLVFDKLLNQAFGSEYRPKLKYDILKIPHHGSKKGLTVSFLRLADPTYGVISSGKNNSYGHPSQKVLDMLQAQKVKVRRTDIEGDIVFKLKVRS